MGVVYKLKDDVVQFIVSYKKDNPSASCRSLADLTSQKFQVKVSKSSVGEILKSSSLNNPLGRPRVKVPLPKFEIPKEKKIQIAASVEKVNFLKQKDLFTRSQDAPKKNIKADEKKENFKIDAFLEIPKIEKTGKENIPARPEVLNVPENDIKNALPEVVLSIQKIKDDKLGPLIPGAGAVFYKSMDWFFQAAVFINQLLKDSVLRDELPENLNDLLASLLYLKLFENKDQSFEDGSLDRLYAFDGLEEVSKVQALKDWSQSIIIPLGVFLKYQQEKEQLFVLSRGFSVELKDGTSFSIDGNCFSFYSRSLERKESFLASALVSRLTNQFISNNSPFVLCMDSHAENFSNIFYQFLACCENVQDKQIKKIIIEDEKGGDGVVFAVIPRKKRSFIVGIFPEHTLFQEILKISKWPMRKSFYHQALCGEIFFSESRTNYFHDHFEGAVQDLRVITLWKDKNKDPQQMLLTNDLFLSADQIVKNYLKQWPLLEKGRSAVDHLKGSDEEGVEGLEINAKGFEDSQMSFWKKENKTLGDLLDDLSLDLGSCYLKMFFGDDGPAETSDLRWFGRELSGHIIKEKDFIGIILRIPKDEQRVDKLIKIVGRINDACLCDQQGRRLFFDVLVE